MLPLSVPTQTIFPRPFVVPQKVACIYALHVIIYTGFRVCPSRRYKPVLGRHSIRRLANRFYGVLPRDTFGDRSIRKLFIHPTSSQTRPLRGVGGFSILALVICFFLSSVLPSSTSLIKVHLTWIFRSADSCVKLNSIRITYCYILCNGDALKTSV